MDKLFVIVTLISVVYGAPSSNTCGCVCGTSNRQMRIVGGNEAKKNEFPWVAGLSMGKDFICGASLITRRHLLTAAHCVHGFDLKTIQVTLADHDRGDPLRDANVVKRAIKSANVHANYDEVTKNNDIAVLELDAPVEFDPKIQPACLPLKAGANYTGREATVAGWGLPKEREEPTALLQKVTMPVWSREDCLDAGYQRKQITENMFCAGYKEGKKDACRGDSGGPLHVSNDAGSLEVVGVVSWGRGCGRPNLPGVYTKVDNYLDWLHESLNGECVCPPIYSAN